jgi:hypothetical protein
MCAASGAVNAAVYVKSREYHVPPIIVWRRTLQHLPSVGSPVTVNDVAVVPAAGKYPIS